MDERLHNIGSGALFDIDNNGIDELILIYNLNLETETGTYPCHVCSLYTIDGGQAVALLEKEHLYDLAGGPSAFVGVVNVEGSNQFALAYETGDTGNFDGKLRYGEWALYQVTGSTVSQKDHIAFEKRLSESDSVIYDASNCEFNGVETQFYDYEAWRNSLKEIFVLENTVDNQNHGMTLEELLTYLTKEAPESTPEMTPCSEVNETPAIDVAWKQLYIQYIQEHDHPGVSQYQLIELNGDSVPELLIDHVIIAYGSELCTISENQINTLCISSGGLSYLPQQNLFLDSGGRMDTYYETIYTISNGQFVPLHYGEYTIDYQYLDENGNPMYFYSWDDINLSKEEYSKVLTSAFPPNQALDPYANMMDAEGILSAIASR